MSDAITAARTQIEARITGDTSDNAGLYKAGGSNLLARFFYERLPDNPGMPYLLYTIEETRRDAGGAEIAELTVTFTAAKRRVYDDRDGSYDDLEAILTRVKDLFDVTAGATKLSDQSGWVFTPMTLRGTAAVSTGDKNTSAMSATYSLGAGNPDTFATGFGFGISITAGGESFADYRLFAIEYDQGQPAADVSLLGGYGQNQDEYKRITAASGKTWTIGLTLLLEDGFSAAPVIPTGAVSAMTLTLASGATITTGTGGVAVITQCAFRGRRDASPLLLSYRIDMSGATTPEYGV